MAAFSRSRPARPTGLKVLIACEGDSERNYLESIRQFLRLPSGRVIALNGKGTDPLAVVQCAIEHRKSLQDERAWNKSDTAWAALDGDEHRDNHLENWHQALDLAARNHVRLALSNPCLELWYLWHFQDQNAALHRDEAGRLLAGHVPSYQKPASLYGAGSQQNAIERAQRLRTRHERNSVPFHTNPCSGMDQLVTALLSLRSSHGAAA